MSDRQTVLDRVMVAAPCTVSWDEMAGNSDKIRFCNLCQLNVYNAREMTEGELIDLLSKEGPRPCLRLFRRADGTIITDNCPVGLRKIRNGARRVWQAIAAACAMVFSVVSSGSHEVEAKTPKAPSSALSELKSPRDDRVLKCVQRARAASNGRNLRKAERYYKTAIKFLALAKHDVAFELLVLSEYKALLERMNDNVKAKQITEKIAALQKTLAAENKPRDTNGFSCEPTILDERYMRKGRSERTLALPGTLPPDAPIPDNK